MSKAILVMDMPKNCNECDVICTKYYSALHNGDIAVLTKPNGCPLKELPQRKGLLNQLPMYDTDTHYEQGWNACIDEILKGSEENE